MRGVRECKSRIWGDTNAVYVAIDSDSKVAQTTQPNDMVLFDFDRRGRLIGIEIDYDPNLLLCLDCGLGAWEFKEGNRWVHEDFYVQNELWNATVPEDGIICIGCFEKRLGRRLAKADFTSKPRIHSISGRAPSKRYVNRCPA